MWSGTSVHTCRGHQGTLGSSSSTLRLFFLDRFLLNLGLTFSWPGWKSTSPSAPPVSAWFRTGVTMPVWDIVSWDSSPDPHGCVESTRNCWAISLAPQLGTALIFCITYIEGSYRYQQVPQGVFFACLVAFLIYQIRSSEHKRSDLTPLTSHWDNHCTPCRQAGCPS